MYATIKHPWAHRTVRLGPIVVLRDELAEKLGMGVETYSLRRTARAARWRRNKVTYIAQSFPFRHNTIQAKEAIKWFDRASRLHFQRVFPLAKFQEVFDLAPPKR